MLNKLFEVNNADTNIQYALLLYRQELCYVTICISVHHYLWI